MDNAAVLAVMVSKLPVNQRQKALRYGILGAYIFRGAALFAASVLVKFGYLKVLGGLYLLYLAITGLKGEDETKRINPSTKSFWATVAMVEVMDIAFSIDNIFAAVALDSRFWVIMTGVGIGILAMRFVAGQFVKLMEKYPFLGKSAYIAILLLGLKLVVDGTMHYIHLPKAHILTTVMESHLFDAIFSGCLMLIFFLPLLWRKKEIGYKI